MVDRARRRKGARYVCETAFSCPQARAVGLEILEAACRRRPKATWLRLFLARLYEEEARLREAIEQYLAVLRLEPDHEGALAALEDLASRLPMDQKILDRIIVSRLLLDPASAHAHLHLDFVEDLAAVWKALSEAYREVPAKPSEPYYLSTMVEVDPRWFHPDGFIWFYSSTDEEKPATPFRLLRESRFTQKLIALLREIAAGS